MANPPDADQPTAFVIMPFSSDFDDVYAIIKRAVTEVDSGLHLTRLDEVRAAGRISDDLVSALESAALCIADVSGANPNVMWEVGYATALKKPLIVLNQETSRLPFDIADVRALMYDRNSLSKTLQLELPAAIRETLERYSVSSSALERSPQLPDIRSMSVTGSMDCPPDKAKARLDLRLRPYFGRDLHWFCGSFGIVDEVAIELLLEAGERNISVVGYSSWDISGPVLDLLNAHPEILFVDASSEQLVKVSEPPSLRDVFFAARSDYVMVAWDGVSVGTRQLINWLALQEIDHAVCFVPPLFQESSNPLER